jgi:hypothetical protein
MNDVGSGQMAKAGAVIDDDATFIFTISSERAGSMVGFRFFDLLQPPLLSLNRWSDFRGPPQLVIAPWMRTLLVPL